MLSLAIDSVRVAGVGQSIDSTYQGFSVTVTAAEYGTLFIASRGGPAEFRVEYGRSGL